MDESHCLSVSTWTVDTPAPVLHMESFQSCVSKGLGLDQMEESLASSRLWDFLGFDSWNLRGMTFTRVNCVNPFTPVSHHCHYMSSPHTATPFSICLLSCSIASSVHLPKSLRLHETIESFIGDTLSKNDHEEKHNEVFILSLKHILVSLKQKIFI